MTASTRAVDLQGGLLPVNKRTVGPIDLKTRATQKIGGVGRGLQGGVKETQLDSWGEGDIHRQLLTFLNSRRWYGRSL